MWVTHTQPSDGKQYYFDTETGRSTWDKPDELKGDRERALENCPWKEYETPEGKKYYSHNVSKQTVWDPPPEYVAILEKFPLSESQPVQSTPALPPVPPKLQQHQHQPIPTPSFPLPPRPSDSVAEAAASATTTTNVVPSLPLPMPLPLPLSLVPQLPQQQQLPPTPASAPILPMPIPPTLPHIQQQQQQQQAGMQFLATMAGMMPPPPPPPPLFQPQHQFVQQQKQHHPHLPHHPHHLQTASLKDGTSGGLDHQTDSSAAFVPSYETREDAERAFKGLLVEANVGLDWTWEQTMRAIIGKPIYRALKTLAERKQAFQDYLEEKRREEREAARLAHERAKATFRSLVTIALPNLTGSTRYAKVCRALAGDAEFEAIGERLREVFYEEMIDEIRAKEKEEQRLRRRDALDRLRHVLQTTPAITVETSWKEARHILNAAYESLHPAPPINNHKSVSESDAAADSTTHQQQQIMGLFSGGIDLIDVLGVFEEHMKMLETAFHDARARGVLVSRRAERKSREAFRALLDALTHGGGRVSSGGGVGLETVAATTAGPKTTSIVDIPPIHPGCKWKDVYPIIKDDPAFIACVTYAAAAAAGGGGGSTPLEMFWDKLAELDFRYQEDKKDILDAIRSIGLVVTIDTPFETFLEDFISSFRDRLCPFSKVTIKLVFDEFMSKALAKQKDERRRQEKKVRKLRDSLKSFLKKLQPPVTVMSTWYDVRGVVAAQMEFEELPEDHKVEVFEKLIRRLKEKAEDASGSEDDEVDGAVGGEARRKRRHREEEERKKSRRADESPSEDEHYKTAKRRHFDEIGFSGGERERDRERDRRRY